MTRTLVGAAPPWSEQPSEPPASPNRQPATPAARARLREAGIPERELITASQGVVRLADVQQIIEDRTPITPREPDADASVPAPQAAGEGYWLAADVPLSIDNSAARAAGVLRAVASVMRTWRATPVSARVVVAGDDEPATWTTTRFDDVTSFDSVAIARQIGNNSEQHTEPDHGDEAGQVDLEMLEATGTTAVRMRPPARSCVMITLGCPQRRVIPITRDDGGIVVTVALVTEIWLYSGYLGAPEGAALLKAAKSALSKEAS